MEFKLYSYWRSSAAYRVRIVLNLKGIDWQYQAVSLIAEGGQHKSHEYNKINPQQLVPSLAVDGKVITQSVAIMEYLEQIQPDPPLLPNDAHDKAYVRSLVQLIACDIHPLNNLRVLAYLTNEFDLSEHAKIKWMTQWISIGFQAMENRLINAKSNGQYCFGNTPTMADCTLIPQLYNARRFKLDLKPYPTLLNIEANCFKLGEFINAKPENQPDAV